MNFINKLPYYNFLKKSEKVIEYFLKELFINEKTLDGIITKTVKNDDNYDEFFLIFANLTNVDHLDKVFFQSLKESTSKFDYDTVYPLVRCIIIFENLYGGKHNQLIEKVMNSVTHIKLFDDLFLIMFVFYSNKDFFSNQRDS